MSRLYEVMFMLPPAAEEAQVDERLRLVESLAKEAGGEMAEVERFGRRKLAYKIRAFDEASYTAARFRSNGSTNAEMERRFRLDPDMLRFLFVRLDEEMRYAEKRAREHAELRKNRPAPPEGAPSGATPQAPPTAGARPSSGGEAAS